MGQRYEGQETSKARQEIKVGGVMDDATVISKLKADLTWIQKHERILLALVAAVAIWFAIGKVDTLIANHDHANLQQAQVAAAVQTAKNEETAAVVAQQAADLKELKAQMAAQVAAVEAEKVALINALSQQKKADAVMTPTELTNRWNVLVPSAKAAVSPSGEIALSSTGAVATVQQLEEVPVLTKELASSQGELATANKMIQSQGDQVATLNTLISGKDALLKDADKVCQEQIKVVKDDAAKSKRRWYVAGVATVVVARVAVKILFGI
jgi:hypothetical protein